jgi:nucleoside 2-deoxyribosyltransferase
LLYQNRLSHEEEGMIFSLACVAFEWHLRHKATFELNASFVLTDDGMLPFSPYSAFPKSRIFTPDEMLALFPKPAEIIDRTLLNLSCLAKHPMAYITVQEDMPFLSFCPDSVVKGPFYYLTKLGLIEDWGSSCSEALVTITPVGWRRIQELSKTTHESKQAFVAMWFDEQMDASYRDAIKPAIETAGFECKRIDTVEHNNKICDEIIAEIRKSRFVVADFTGLRGGVYFEAGYAMGMGLPVIWLVRKDDVDKLHFDTRQYNHIIYVSAEDLKKQLYNRIAATIH